MENIQECLEELSELVSQDLGNAQPQTLGKVADLYFLTEDQQSGSDTELFGTLLEQLAYQVDASERMLLAERVKASRKGPPSLIRRLAADEIIVARPVLQYSTAFADEDLAALSRELGPDHQIAIAIRRNVPESVTDVLIEQGDASILSVLLQNAGAAFSANAIAQLSERAKTDEQLAQLTEARLEFGGRSFIRRLGTALPDFRPHALAHLLTGELPDFTPRFSLRLIKDALPKSGWNFPTRLWKRIVTLIHSLFFDVVDGDGVSAAATDGGAGKGGEPAGGAPQDGEDDPLDGLVQYAPEGSEDNKPENKSAQLVQSEENLIEVARGRLVPETIGGLAAITEIGEDVVERCLLKSKISILVILCKAYRLSSSALLALLEIRASVTGEKLTNTVSLLRRYDSIPVEEAKQIVKTSPDYKSNEPDAETD